MPFGQGVVLLELLEERKRAEWEVNAAKGRLAQLNIKINELVKPALENAYVREGKPAGTVKFALDNHMFQAVVDKRVDWDSDALEDIAKSLPFEDVKELFRVKYSMAEAVYSKIASPTLKAKLTVARTVKYSPPVISSTEKVSAHT